MQQDYYNEEIAKFDKISDDWWLGNTSFDLLHQINPIRLNYIRKAIFTYKKLLDLKHLKILDVGCGGGLLSIPLAKLGAQVTALDGGVNNIKIARDKALESNIDNINFICAPIENHDDNEKYDVIICLEMIEHVDDQNMLLKKLSHILKPNGLFILSTLNKTYLSWFLSIYMAENIVSLLPKHTHDYEKFIKPEKISQVLEQCNVILKDIKGLMWHPVRKWHVSNQIIANYILTAQKKHL